MGVALEDAEVAKLGAPRRCWRMVSLWAALLVALSSSLFLAYLTYGAIGGKMGAPPFLGSGKRVEKLLPVRRRDEAYSFLVLGDSKNNFVVLKDLLLKADGKVDFAVFLGDAVSANASSQAYFRESLSGMELSYPVFYVSGNNDFSSSAKNSFQGVFTSEDFERTYGPLCFSFAHGGDLFVGICSVGNSDLDAKSLEFLKSLEKTRRRYKRCFVFEHIPPKGVPGYDSGEFQADPRFAGEFERLGADYVFASHFHGFQEVAFQGVEYIVTGGAGAGFDDPDGTGQVFHAVEFSVLPDAVRRRLVFSSSSGGASSRFESFMMCAAIPLFQHYKLFWMALIVVCVVGWFCVVLLARRRKARVEVGIAGGVGRAYIGMEGGDLEGREKQ